MVSPPRHNNGITTNRATTIEFRKATWRDKAVITSSTAKRIGMRKTLVFYLRHAPHGQKTDWIMHEYRLDNSSPSLSIHNGATHSVILEFPPLQTHLHVCLFSFSSLYRDHGRDKHSSSSLFFG